MLTGTPLDLTPFGGVLAALGWLSWLLALGNVVLALWWSKRWWMTLVSAAVVLGADVYPVFICPVEKHVETVRNELDRFKTKFDAASAHFEMRCKGAGEKVVPTGDNVLLRVAAMCLVAAVRPASKLAHRISDDIASSRTVVAGLILGAANTHERSAAWPA